MDEDLIKQNGHQQLRFERQIGNLVGRAVPQRWNAIDLGRRACAC